MTKKHFTILYDGDCPICQAEVKRLKRWNRQGKLGFEDIAVDHFKAEKYQRTLKKLMAEIHGVYPDGTVISGMQVFRESYSAVGKGWLLVPTQWPIFRTLFDIVYKCFACHRIRLGKWFGQGTSNS